MSVSLELMIRSVLVLTMFLNLDHYKWALDELFIKHDFRRVIILEGLISLMVLVLRCFRMPSHFHG